MRTGSPGIMRMSAKMITETVKSTAIVGPMRERKNRSISRVPPSGQVGDEYPSRVGPRQAGDYLRTGYLRSIAAPVLSAAIVSSVFCSRASSCFATTRSTRLMARSVMRRPPQLGQNLGPCWRAAPDARARSLAAEARKPRVEDATQLEVRELALDELRQSGFLARLGRGTQEGVEVGGDDPMEHGVLGVSRGHTRARRTPFPSIACRARRANVQRWIRRRVPPATGP